jgi:hypothetical protein
VLGIRCLHRPFSINRVHTSVLTIEIENAILKPLHCTRRITDSLTGKNVTILNHDQNLLRDHKLTVGDQTTITL